MHQINNVANFPLPSLLTFFLVSFYKIFVLYSCIILWILVGIALLYAGALLFYYHRVFSVKSPTSARCTAKIWTQDLPRCRGRANSLLNNRSRFERRFCLAAGGRSNSLFNTDPNVATVHQSHISQHPRTHPSSCSYAILKIISPQGIICGVASLIG